MNSHYFDIRFSDMKNFMINQLFMKIHGFIKEKGINISIDLPNMVNDEFDCNLGNTLRIFGTLDNLELLRSEKRISVFIDHVSGVRYTNIKPVPSNHAFVSLKRYRWVDKQKKRDNHRYPYLMYNKKIDVKGQVDENGKEFYDIKRIRFYLSRQISNVKGAEEYTSYGLCKEGSTVPMF